eukprot:Awhi_evm1s13898
MDFASLMQAELSKGKKEIEKLKNSSGKSHIKQSEAINIKYNTKRTTSKVNSQEQKANSPQLLEGTSSSGSLSATSK